MTGREHILRLALLYGGALGVERTTVSWRLFKDTNKLDAIANGKDLYVGRYERAMLFFAENWPAQLGWPSDVPRPKSPPVPAPSLPEQARAAS